MASSKALARTPASPNIPSGKHSRSSYSTSFFAICATLIPLLSATPRPSSRFIPACHVPGQPSARGPPLPPTASSTPPHRAYLALRWGRDADPGVLTVDRGEMWGTVERSGGKGPGGEHLCFSVLTPPGLTRRAG